MLNVKEGGQIRTALLQVATECGGKVKGVMGSRRQRPPFSHVVALYALTNA